MEYMKFCKNCGAKLKDGAAFCESCGAPVNTAAQPQQPSQQPQTPVQQPRPQQPVQQQSQPQAQRQAPMNQPRPQQPIQPQAGYQAPPVQEKKKSKKPVIIAVCVILAIAIIGAVLALLFIIRPIPAPDPNATTITEATEASTAKPEETTAQPVAKTDYTELDNTLKEFSGNFLNGEMQFRMVGDKIYFTNAMAQPTAIYTFDTKTSKVEKFMDLKSLKELNMKDSAYIDVRFMAAGVEIVYCDYGNENAEDDRVIYEAFNYNKENIEYNASDITLEFDGKLFYNCDKEAKNQKVETVSINAKNWKDSKTIFDSKKDMLNFNQMMISEVYTFGDKVYARLNSEYEGDESDIYIVDVKTKKIVLQFGNGYTFLSDKYYYYSEDGSLYKVDMTADVLAPQKIASIKEGNPLYCVTEDRAYYFDMSDESEPTAKYVELNK